MLREPNDELSFQIQFELNVRLTCCTTLRQIFVDPLAQPEQLFPCHLMARWRRTEDSSKMFRDSDNRRQNLVFSTLPGICGSRILVGWPRRWPESEILTLINVSRHVFLHVKNEVFIKWQMESSVNSAKKSSKSILKVMYSELVTVKSKMSVCLSVTFDNRIRYLASKIFSKLFLSRQSRNINGIEWVKCGMK